jgi:hypothetical protein
VLLYAPFSQSGFPPFVAAVLINVGSFLMLASVFPRSRLASCLLLVIGLSWSFWAPTVNTDLPSTALLGAGIVMMARKRYPLAVTLAMLILLAVASRCIGIPKEALLGLALAILGSWSVDAVQKGDIDPGTGN